MDRKLYRIKIVSLRTNVKGKGTVYQTVNSLKKGYDYQINLVKNFVFRTFIMIIRKLFLNLKHITKVLIN